MAKTSNEALLAIQTLRKFCAESVPNFLAIRLNASGSVDLITDKSGRIESASYDDAVSMLLILHSRKVMAEQDVWRKEPTP